MDILHKLPEAITCASKLFWHLSLVNLWEDKGAKKKEACTDRNQGPGLIALMHSRDELKLSAEKVGHSEEPAPLGGNSVLY